MAESPHLSGSSDLLPEVRIEARQGKARPLLYEVSDVAFLVGSVQGCDLRVPGADLPPVICMIVRRAGAVAIRRLAPTQPVQVNGQLISHTSLSDGDRITLGSLELIVHAQFPSQESAGEPPAGDPATAPAAQASPACPAIDMAALEERACELDARQRQLQEQTEALESDRVIWYGRRHQIEHEQRLLQELQRDFADASAKLRQREEAVQQAQELMDRQRQDLQPDKDKLAAEQQQIEQVRKELSGLRQELYDRYRERRDRVAGLQEAVNRAAEKVQERKRQLDAEIAQAAAARKEEEVRQDEWRQQETARQQELDARAQELNKVRQYLEELHGQLERREQELRQQQETYAANADTRERQLAQDREAFEAKRLQYEADVIRMDRWAASLEERQRQMDARAQEVDRRYEQMQRDSRDMEEQARQLDEWHTKLCREAEQFGQQRVEIEAQSADTAKRAAELEGQQGMLAALRTRLERMREEIRSGEQLLIDQRTRQEQAESELRHKLEELKATQADLDQQRQAQADEKRQLDERAAQAQSTVQQLRRLKEKLTAEAEQLHLRATALDARTAEEAESTSALQTRSAQLLELQERLAADRKSIREREMELGQAEAARETLQEQLRRRAEELNERLTSLAERERQQTELAADLERRRTEIDQRMLDVTQRDETLRRNVERLKESGRTIGTARKVLGQERARWQADQQQASIAADQQQADFESMRQEVIELQRTLPEWEEQARAAGERLAAVREQLQQHMAQFHDYVRQGQEAFAATRSGAQADAEQVQRQALELNRVRDEHRLAVAAFRQQLIGWQGQVAEMRQALSRDESRLERRHAEVEATSLRLAQQAEELEVQEREVTERRSEVERHLDDMREWYRRKLRELSERHRVEDPEGAQDSDEPDGEASSGERRDILSLTGPVAPGDRQLGDLLQSLELVEADTLTALLVEARRQKQSLRQVLLASGSVTLYQLALIEAGNLDGLVLGPVRVLDRLRATPRESAYRVYDPRHAEAGSDGEALLRHLAEDEMQDAVHPDEFRQRFAAAAAIGHANVAATWEVLEINGRPAVLQEWLTGLSAADWPALVTVSGVWYRLVSQVAQGLMAVHEAGLVHGRLDASRLLLTSEGVVKICGVGEPFWLAGHGSPAAEPTPDDDLAALGRLATSWATMPLPRKAGKPKPLAEALQPILWRLSAEANDAHYPSAATLLEDLDRIRDSVPANPEAWNRFLRFVRERTSGGKTLRQSA
jgi:chromosome segregation ATPase